MEMQSQASFSQMPRDELLKLIHASGFTMRDLALYLDTHPDCEDALAHYTMQAEALEAAMSAYAQRFGALRQCDIPQSPNGWSAWAQTAWPWEKEA